MNLFISDVLLYSYEPPHMAKQKQDDQLEHTYSNHVTIRDVSLKTCQRRWMIGRCGDRGSGISVLAARHDDDDDDDDDDDELVLLGKLWTLLSPPAITKVMLLVYFYNDIFWFI